MTKKASGKLSYKIRVADPAPDPTLEKQPGSDLVKFIPFFSLKIRLKFFRYWYINLLNYEFGQWYWCFDSTLRQFRNVLGTAGVETFIVHNHSDANDPNNGSLVIDGSALQGGGGGIPATIATFASSLIQFLQPCECLQSLVVSGTTNLSSTGVTNKL